MLLNVLFLTGLLNLMPLSEHHFPREYVKQVSGRFTAGGLVAMQLRSGITLTVDGISVHQDDGLAVFGFGRDATAETHIIFNDNGHQKTMYYPLASRDYDIQYIEGVAPQYVHPSEKVLERIRHESAQKRKARVTHGGQATFKKGFIWPLIGRISGVYGSQRFFNGQPRRPHYGVDIVAPKGSVVRAMAAGKVTLAEHNMYYEGGLIFIDHGLDIMSAYLHLSDLDISVGENVIAGQIIGRVGISGRSTGHHLDWRVYWRNKRLDPMLLVEDMPIQ